MAALQFDNEMVDFRRYYNKSGTFSLDDESEVEKHRMEDRLEQTAVEFGKLEVSEDNKEIAVDGQAITEDNVDG